MPSLVNFKYAIIFRSFHLDFLCANLAAPIISYHLFSNFHFTRHVIHPGKCSPVPSSVGFNTSSPIISQILLIEFSCACSATPIAQDHLFSKLRSGCIRFNLKTPLQPSPACFNHLIIFESLLLESICPLPTLQMPPQDSLPTLGLVMTALPGLASAALSGLTAAGTRSLGRISSSLQPSEALLSIRDLLLVNLGPVKAAGAH